MKDFYPFTSKDKEDTFLKNLGFDIRKTISRPIIFQGGKIKDLPVIKLYENQG